MFSGSHSTDESNVIHPGANIDALRAYLNSEENISESDFENILNDAIEIVTRCVPVNSVGSTQGLIYGNVQSGKTAVIITVVALALDNGYRNFVILTSDLNDLYLQTLTRIENALHSFSVIGKEGFRQPTPLAPNVPIVLVSSKNPSWLPRLRDFISQTGRSGQSFILIDDEADQASLDTNVNRPNQPRSSINRNIDALRNSLSSHSFLQTTATPQSLFLQDENNNFRPSFVAITTPGSGYVGGNDFFGSDDFSESPYLRLVPLVDLNLLRNEHLPRSIEQSLFLFFSGAAVLRMQGYVNNYTYLLHTSLRQDDHTQASLLVDRFVTQITTEVAPGGTLSNQILQGFQSAYEDLQTTFEDLPLFQDVIDEVRNYIVSTSVTTVNSSTGQGVDPNPSRRHTIYIGGTKIGRGVTIRNLLVTYYGRDAQSPQMDTVLQHARMYGYRQNALSATRIYLPRHLAQRFYDIHQSDNVVRLTCQSSHEPISLIPLAIGMRPTRRSVLNRLTVQERTFIAGSQYFPQRPISSPEVVEEQTPILDELLSQDRYPELQMPYEVSLDEIAEILSFRFSQSPSGGLWQDELVRESINLLRNNLGFENRGSIIIVNRSANISRSPNTGLTRAIIPGGAGNPPFNSNPNRPVLLMTRLNGQALRNWDGLPFWVPVFRYPNGNYAFAVNFSSTQ